MSDNAHGNGHLPTIPPATAVDPQRTSQPDGTFDVTADTLRLLIGALLVGTDEFQHRLQRWQATARSSPSSASPLSAAASVQRTNVPRSLRSAIVGLLFESETAVRRRFSMMATRLMDFSNEAEYVFATTLAPAARSTPVEPLMQLFDEATFIALSTLDRWTARGWLEELQGRRLAREAASSVMDELFNYMARNPDLRELIEQQGTSVAGDAVDHVRERTASADMWIERLAHSLLHRPLNSAPVSSGASMDAPVVREHDG